MRLKQRHTLKPSRRGHSTARSEDPSIPLRTGFTLIELLVVLAIIALIIGILLVSMRGVRSSVRRTESANALRQMVAAYDAYSTDHNKRLMPGYVDVGLVASLDIYAKAPDNSRMTEEDSRSYVWRLAPYLGNEWETMFIDYGSARLMAKLSAEYQNEIYGPGTITDPMTQFGIARIPAFGLNSIFLGGDSVHGGAVVAPFHPWNTAGNDTIAAVRYSDVKSPALQIVFAPVRQGNDAVLPTAPFPDVEFGHPELRPPFLTLTSGGIWDDRQWEVSGDSMSVVMSSAADAAGCYAFGGGLPIARWGNGALPVGNLDGSVTIETLIDISNNMTRWSHRAVGQYVGE